MDQNQGIQPEKKAKKMERAKGIEPSTVTLATWRSTAELCPLEVGQCF